MKIHAIITIHIYKFLFTWVVCFAATHDTFLNIPFPTIKKHIKTHKNEVTILRWLKNEAKMLAKIKNPFPQYPFLTIF